MKQALTLLSLSSYIRFTHQSLFFHFLVKILFINVCISILSLFILQSIRGTQFEITAIQIFRKRRLSLKNVSKFISRKKSNFKVT